MGFFSGLVAAAPLISSAVSLFGGERRNAAQIEQAGVANAFSAKQVLEQQKFNRAEAQKNRDFQERMSNTSYQRSIKDLRKAGLNPILAAMKGGSTTPPGATATASSAKGQQADIKDTLSPAIERGLNVASAQAQIEHTKELAEKTRIEQDKVRQETENLKATKLNIEANTVERYINQKKLTSEFKKIDQETRNLGEDRVIKKQQQVLNKIEMKLRETQSQTAKESLLQLKTKMEEMKAKENFWQAVGPYMMYADKVVKGGIGLASIFGAAKAFGLKNAAKPVDKLLQSDTVKHGRNLTRKTYKYGKAK